MTNNTKNIYKSSEEQCTYAYVDASLNDSVNVSVNDVGGFSG